MIELDRERERADPANAYTILAWDVVDLLSVRGTMYEDACARATAKEWRVDTLRGWLKARQLDADGKRAQLVERVRKHLQKQGVLNISTHNIGVLAVQLFHFLDQQPQLLAAQWVIIENQPALKNPTMKSVQMMLYAYFVYRGVYKRTALSGEVPQQVQFMSASNKLKIYDGPPVDLGKAANGQSWKKYKKTKLLSVAYTRYYLERWSGALDSHEKPDAVVAPELVARQHVMRSWLQFLNASNKQDDLGDSLLQGMYALAYTCDNKAPKSKRKPKVISGTGGGGGT